MHRTQSLFHRLSSSLPLIAFDNYTSNYFSDKVPTGNDVISTSSKFDDDVKYIINPSYTESDTISNFIPESEVIVLKVPITSRVDTKLVHSSLDDTSEPSLSFTEFASKTSPTTYYWTSDQDSYHSTDPRLPPVVEDSVTGVQSGTGSNRSGRNRRRVEKNIVNNFGPSARSLDIPLEDLQKGRKRPGSSPDIDDIIHGIMKLLGGNVKIKSTELADTKLTTFGNNPTKYITSTRINNRGPPRLPLLPFGMLPPGLTRPPIRPPITPPTDLYGDGRPPFVANTRPPFLVPLPPALTSVHSHSKPYLTGIPIPEDVLAHITSSASPEAEDIGMGFDSATVNSTSAVNQSAATATPDQEVEPTITASALNESEDVSLLVSHPTEIMSSNDYTTTDSILDFSSTIVPSLESSMMSSTAVISQNSEIMSKSPTVKSTNLISSTTKSTVSTDESDAGSSRTPALSDVPITAFVSDENQIFSSSVPKKASSILSKTSSKRPITTSDASEVYSASTVPSDSSANFPQFPSRLPDPIRPFMTTGHPGIVLADTIDYKSVYSDGVITAPLYRPYDSGGPDIFDVTVSASQGYGSPAQPPKYNAEKYMEPLITSAIQPGDGSVYIDGRKTYFDLMPATASNVLQTLGVGTVIPEEPEGVQRYPGNQGPIRPSPTIPTPVLQQSPQGTRTPPQRPSGTLGPPKRIDTCIVGYDTTCNEELGEVCRTEGDVSSCSCKPGTARRRSRTKCKKSVLLHLSLKVDRVGDRRIVWGGNYANPESREYQFLVHESEKALDNALSQSQAMSQLYLDSYVNKFYSLGGRVIVNSTIKLLHTPQTASPNIRKSLQRHLIRVIQGHNNYIGNSVLAVEGTLNPIPDVSDVNECFDPSLFDCHKNAACSNVFGSYLCTCNKGFTDRYPDDVTKSGRFCDSCSRDFCSKKGECRIENGQNVCICEKSFYGARCEIDGEVVAVAVGASVAAVVIIILTLIFLCMWSRKWKAQDRKTQILSRIQGGFFGWRSRSGGREGFPVNVHQKGMGTGPYGVTMEDRLRWAQMVEQITQQNVYSPQGGVGRNATLTSSAILSLGTSTLATPYQETWSSGHHPYRWRRGRIFEELLRLFSRRSQKAKGAAVDGNVTPLEAYTLHQFMSAQTGPAAPQNQQPDQLRPGAFYQEQRKAAPPPSEYATVGTLLDFPQQFGMQHMNPQFIPPPYAPSKAASTYGQFGPASLNTAASIGGVSRAPTIGARTPMSFRDLGGGASMGPLGGGAIAHKIKNHDGGGGTTDSSEEDPDRPYHLPRPKSRASALDSNDIYFEPDDLMTSHNYFPPLPLSPPPPIPFQFDHFFKSRFP